MQILPRLAETIVTLALMAFAVFMLIGLMPGDPVDLMIAGNPKITPDDAMRLRALYGLDQPLLSRFWHWLSNAMDGDFGYSRSFGLPVMDVIIPRFLNTGILLGLSLTLTLALAIPLGMQAAVKAGGKQDRLISLLCFAGVSLPSFWTGLLLISLFAVKLQWLPASTQLSGSFSENIMSLILPVAALSLSGLAVYTRHFRSQLIQTFNAEFIKTARAKGCSNSRVRWHHAARAALPSVVTILMLDLGTLFGGALTIETVFAFPGMGKLMFDAVMGNDYNLALCCFLILTAFVLLANLIADLLYPLLDPRIKQADGA